MVASSSGFASSRIGLVEPAGLYAASLARRAYCTPGDGFRKNTNVNNSVGRVAVCAAVLCVAPSRDACRALVSYE